MRYVILTAALFGVACGSGTGPKVGQEFSLAVGERVSIEELGLFVRFLGAADDSRCALRAQCVWPGNALVLIETAPLNGDAKTDTLHTNGTVGPDTLGWSEAVLRLVRLDPYPETPGGIPAEDYVVRLALDAR